MKVVTHDGCFHTDEVLACVLLDILFDNIELVRTRDEEILQSNEEGMMIVDVGGRYDGVKYFDHHQFPDENNYTVKWSDEHKIPLSSAGMVWKAYGKKVINKVFHTHSLNEYDLDDIHNKMYNSFFLEIDANDNGISQYSSEFSGKKRYGIHTTLVGTIGRFNGKNVYNHELQYDLFQEAMSFAEQMFLVHLESYVRSQSTIRFGTERMKYYFNIRKDKHILVVNEDVTGWRSILKKMDKEEEIYFIIYPKDDKWGVRTIPKSGFDARKDLATEDILEREIGNDLVFAHKKKFMCTCKTRESAIKVAEVSMKN